MQPVSYVSLALTFATGAGVLYYYDSRRQAKQAGSLLYLLLQIGSRCTAALVPCCGSGVNRSKRLSQRPSCCRGPPKTKPKPAHPIPGSEHVCACPLSKQRMTSHLTDAVAVLMASAQWRPCMLPGMRAEPMVRRVDTSLWPPPSLEAASVSSTLYRSLARGSGFSPGR